MSQPPVKIEYEERSFSTRYYQFGRQGNNGSSFLLVHSKNNSLIWAPKEEIDENNMLDTYFDISEVKDKVGGHMIQVKDDYDKIWTCNGKSNNITCIKEYKINSIVSSHVT